MRREVQQPPRGNRSNPYARARLKAGLIQETVVNSLHISTQLLSSIENGRTIPAPEIAAMMAELYKNNEILLLTCGQCPIHCHLKTASGKVG